MEVLQILLETKEQIPMTWMLSFWPFEKQLLSSSTKFNERNAEHHTTKHADDAVYANKGPISTFCN